MKNKINYLVVFVLILITTNLSANTSVYIYTTVDNEIITDRNQDKWVEEIYSWENLIKTFSKSKNFNVYFWSGEEFRLNHKLNNQTLKQNNCLSMYVETEGKIPDTHLGINGHNKAADVFLNYINNLINTDPEASLYHTHFNYINSNSEAIKECQPLPTQMTASDYLEYTLKESIDIMATGYVFRSKDYDAIGGIPTSYPNLIYADAAPNRGGSSNKWQLCLF